MNTAGILSGPILLAQCCALFPIVGVSDGNLKHLRFTCKSARFAYALLHSVLQLINTLFYLLFMTRQDELVFDNIVTLLFFSCSFTTSVLFLRLAKVWPELMRFWEKIDKCMGSTYGFPKRLKRSVVLTTVIIIFAATVEHAFFIGFLIINYVNDPKSSSEGLEMFWIQLFNHVFEVVPFNWFTVVVWQVLNLFSTFNWNYMDLFIMLISVSLAERFAQINERVIKLAHDQVIDEEIWAEIRGDYDGLATLSKMLNTALGHIILLSFANNLFVILVQLLHTLEPSTGDTIARLYFMYSFGFLILRTVAVSLMASRIHTESVKSVDVLNHLPTEVFNNEIDRLLVQIKMDPSFFSGKGFFKVRKSLILSITGAIVSYELIFIQFNVIKK